KSIANQALQTPSGYSTKSEASATIAGATADNLLGGTTTPATNAVTTGTVDLSGGFDASGGAVTFTINGASVTLAANGGSGGNGNWSLNDIINQINGTTNVGVIASNDGSGHLRLTSTGT